MNEASSVSTPKTPRGFYDLYEEIGGQLLFIESWTSREAWQVHNGAPSVTKIINFLDGKLARPALVQEMYLAEN